jgi:hypothetical protein
MIQVSLTQRANRADRAVDRHDFDDKAGVQFLDQTIRRATSRVASGRTINSSDLITTCATTPAAWRYSPQSASPRRACSLDGAGKKPTAADCGEYGEAAGFFVASRI